MSIEDVVDYLDDHSVGIVNVIGVLIVIGYVSTAVTASGKKRILRKPLSCTTAVNPTHAKSVEATKHHTIVIQSRTRNDSKRNQVYRHS